MGVNARSTDRQAHPVATVGVLAVLVIVVNGLLAPGGTTPAALTGTLYLAFYGHVAFAIYGGGFGRWRTATWLALIAVWISGEVATFFSHMIPWGQLSFWIVAKVTSLPFGGEALTHLVFSAIQLPFEPRTWPFVMLTVLCLDIAVALGRPRSVLTICLTAAAVAAAALALGVVIDLGLRSGGRPASPLPSGPFNILPAWYLLPFYALLRSVPDKLAGAAVTFAAMLMPLLVPWMKGGRLAEGRPRLAWAVACIALAAIWVSLGLLGSQAPDEGVTTAVQALAACYFAFFLAIPPLLHRFAATGSAER